MQNNAKVLTNYAYSALQCVDLSDFHVNGLAWSWNVLCHKTTQKTNYDFARLRRLNVSIILITKQLRILCIYNLM